MGKLSSIISQATRTTTDSQDHQKQRAPCHQNTDKEEPSSLRALLPHPPCRHLADGMYKTPQHLSRRQKISTSWLTSRIETGHPKLNATSFPMSLHSSFVFAGSSGEIPQNSAYSGIQKGRTLKFL